MKTVKAFVVCLAWTVGALASAQIHAEDRQFQVPAGSLNAALDIFVKQAGVQLIYRVDELHSAHSPGVHGFLSTDAALGALLAGTGFEGRHDPSGAIAIVAAKPQRLSQSTPAAGGRAVSNSRPETAGNSGQLEEIVVSARRTEENLQSVPVAVTSLSGALLDKLNIRDVSGVPQFTPNLNVNVEPGGLTDAAIYIRGIGNNENSGLAELGVGIYLDGVYIARPAASIFDLADPERVEVLRGPQGTLFGRNSIGGAVQLISKKPTDDMHVELKTGFGRYDEWFARARLDTGLIATSPIKASFSYMHHQQNGYFNNTLAPSNEDPGAINSDTFLAAVRGGFDNLTVDYSFDYDIRDGVPAFNQVLVATPAVQSYFGQSASLGGAPFQIGTSPLSSGRQEGYDGRFDSKARVQGHSLTLNYEATPDLTLKSISAYRSFLQNIAFALSGNGGLVGVALNPVTFAPSVQPVTLYNGVNTQHQFQYSQEFQALGKFDDFRYVVGAYYFYEKSTEVAPEELSYLLPGGVALNLSPLSADKGDRTSYALFGQTSYIPGGGNLELTAGLRSTWDHERMTLGGDVVPNLTGYDSFKNLSWLLSANYKFTPDVMTYARVSTGYRGGGINARLSFINVFKPETVLAFETGVKAEMFDHRLRTNLALFYTQYKNEQIQEFLTGTGGVTSIIANAGKVDYSGVELEVAAKLTEGLTLDGSLGYLHPKYVTFDYRDPTTNQVINVADEARLQYSAKFNSHAGAQYTVPLGFGEFETRVDVSYRSTIYFATLDRLNPFTYNVRSPPDHNLHARMDLADIAVGGGKLEVGLWGNNLTNQKNVSYGIDWGSLGFGTATFKEPRTYGIDAKFNY